MIQLISSLPFDVNRISELKKDWSRFQDGKVIFSEIPDAICGEFLCEAEIIPQEVGEQEQEEGESGPLDPNGETEEEDSRKFDELLNNLPSGKGKLILSVSKLYWVKEDMNEDGLVGVVIGWSVDYKNVILHAISKPDDHSEPPHLYLQLSCNRLFDENGHEISFRDAGEDEDEKFVEVKLKVDKEGIVDEMFISLSECAALHPDADEGDEGEADDSCDDNSSDYEPPQKLGKLEEYSRFEDAAEN